ncbi:unnamed protein product [Xylocopa violacea]|uniref:LRRNT domain-containing protein n=1 Tax=Xylocopa violacea TaxID=135666 RepID=A0ABP1NCP6_XYLVO
MHHCRADRGDEPTGKSSNRSAVTRAETSVKIKSVGAVTEDAKGRAVPLVVSNNSSEGRVEGEGGHENGPQKGLVDGLAREQPSSDRLENERESSLEEQGAACGLGGGLADADAGQRTRLTVDTESGLGRSKGCEEALRIEDRGGGGGFGGGGGGGGGDGGSRGVTVLTETPVLVHQWRHQEAALDLELSAGDGSEVRSKRPRNESSADRVIVRGTPHRGGGAICHSQRQRAPGAVRVSGRHHAEAGQRNSNRSCRVHGRRRDRSRVKATERQPSQAARDLTSNEFECSVIRLEQDPILEPVRILGCPPAEGLEISSFLEPAPNYGYPGINVARLASNEQACFSLYDPNNILPKSRAGSIAKILEGPNRAVKDINRKVLAMARAMTPAWSLRLLGVSCGSVVCAWGLLLVLSVLGGGASHGTALGSFGLGSLSGTMEDMNNGRCPWVCTCTSQEVDCSHRALTQIPGDLASLVLAEKL